MNSGNPGFPFPVTLLLHMAGEYPIIFSAGQKFRERLIRTTATSGGTAEEAMS